jgi:hypothetical protein
MSTDLNPLFKALFLPAAAIILGLIPSLAQSEPGILDGIKAKAKNANAAHECQNLMQAMSLYELEYGKQPLQGSGEKGDADRLYLSTSVVMNVLLGKDSEENPREAAFYQGKPAKKLKGGLDTDNNLWDPWGNAYRVLIDYDYDGMIQHVAFEKEHRTKIMIFSNGPDGIPFTDDDVKSWDEE